MTTLVLQAADTALGGLARAGTSYLGGLLAGAISGSGGRNTTRAIEGPRLTEMNGLASTEGAPIPRVYGRARVGGQLIWATRFEEVANTAVDRQTSRGSKSLGSSRRTTTTVTTTYSYHANLAVGLCEGPIAFVRRIWADGRELDQTNLTIRVHPGTEDQVPDPLIVAKEGAENAPAYRGLAYAVFEKLPLAEFGNRVPQLTFEVVRPAEGLRNMIRSVCLIPGAGEFAYETVPTRRELGLGSSVPENTHQFVRSSDAVASLDQLQALCPNLKHVSLVVSWFGSDLRAGHCTVTPRVEIADKATSGSEWSVAGLGRAEAGEVSHSAGRPAYGGTPSDASVVRLVQALKARGLAVTLYPFVMMDIPGGNDLPDPRTGSAGQPPYPWRGRITCDPAPGLPGTVDATPAAAEQVASFFGSAEEWGLRRLVHHYADLAAEAGGVDGFIIGSELVGLTRIRSAPGVYPAVDHLRALAGEVRAKLGPETSITYAADWTEYGTHVLDGGTEVRFPLDPLWADPAIDAVGIDNYAPISDWRDGPTNADAALGRSIRDRDYLRGRLRSGEAFDWHYASEPDRLAQTRTPITDGAFGKPWIFRAKDFAGWWENHHIERSGGVETGTTAWVPGSKPIWLTEIGIPAVDKGPNGPNVFPDPKSVESAVPPFSSGARDDLVQVRALEAMLSGFDPALPGHVEGANPSSPLYGGPMIDPDRVSVWAWDARPFPAFPDLDLVWADGANWEAGHWITGRIEGVPLDRLVRAIMADYGLDAGPDIPLDGFVDGYVIDRPMSARQALEPLAEIFGFDAIASGGAIRWQGRGGRSSTALLASDLVESGNEPVFARSRAQETDLPAAVELSFTDGEGEYGRAAAGSRRVGGTSRREMRLDSAIVTRRAEAQRLADIRLQDEWAGRETASFALSPRRRDLDPGDIVEMEGAGGPMLHRIVRIADGASRKVEARELDPSIFNAPRPAGVLAPRRPAPPSIAGRPAALLLELPASPADPAALQHLAVAADPWPGAIAVWRSLDGGSFSLHAVAHLPAVVGQTTSPVPAGPVWVFDRASVIEAEFSAAALSSIGEEGALGFDSLFAVQGPDGAWEMFSAAFAELIGPRRYRLSGLLRGLGGTEALADRSLAPGASIVQVDEAVIAVASHPADLGRTCIYRIGPADRDHADASYIQLEATVGGTALKPLAPVRLRARRVEAGIELSWIRRTRLGGDNWELAEVPLSEEREAYVVDVLGESGAVQSLEVATTSALYGAADELADFGTPQTSLSVRVAQVSGAVGRGFWAEAILPID